MNFTWLYFRFKSTVAVKFHLNIFPFEARLFDFLISKWRHWDGNFLRIGGGRCFESTFKTEPDFEKKTEKSSFDAQKLLIEKNFTKYRK